jgi:hypothetical protein
VKVLVTGSGNSGSWQIRGEQLGSEIGAVVKSRRVISHLDIQAADLVVVVKRVDSKVLRMIREAKKPWVFDAVDFYPQPECATWSKEVAIRWVKNRITEYRPNAIVWPNGQMMEDCNTGLTETVIYHHYRPGIAINPIRLEIKTIAYEGGEQYLGGWLQEITRECERRGWAFVVNPRNMADIDVVLAVRDVRGYAQRSWKSNVKLANAHASGTPFIGSPECGYIETATGKERWIISLSDLTQMLDDLEDYNTRKAISETFIQAAIPVERAAAQLKELLNGL